MSEIGVDIFTIDMKYIIWKYVFLSLLAFMTGFCKAFLFRYKKRQDYGVAGRAMYFFRVINLLLLSRSYFHPVSFSLFPKWNKLLQVPDVMMAPLF